ncbi:MAG: capsular biosynthesis protein [Firmicutes bacterium]|nr:capsular biosynthesis protein [Bacillota bacterium]
MYDMHCHIVPKVDDGADSFETSIKMIKIAKRNGFKGIFATPHYVDNTTYNNTKLIKENFLKLKDKIKKEGLDIDIYIGNEVYVVPNLIKLFEKGFIYTLNNSRYMLIEFPMLDNPYFIESLIYDLKVKGIVPIIAHPERYKMITNNPNVLFKLIKQGALVQINLPSLKGSYGPIIKDTAKKLIEHNMIHFVGTDAHSFNIRTPNVEKPFKILKSHLDNKKLKKILYENPKAVINDKEIKIWEPKECVKQSKINKFIRRYLTEKNKRN